MLQIFSYLKIYTNKFNSKGLLIIVLLLAMILGCNYNNSTNNRALKDQKYDSLMKNIKNDIDTTIQQFNNDEFKNTNDPIKEKVKVLVVLCSNGYEYALKGFDFNPIIERELKKQSPFEIVTFSYKKLMGVPYQGVYDKKFAQPIIERIDADIFVMTRFTGDVLPGTPNESKSNWGYECKILNTKTGVQKISISANHLVNYRDIEKDIIINSKKLIGDIESIK